MEPAAGKAAERSGAGFPAAAGGRSVVPRSLETVTERDRRRPRGKNPNSRQSRLAPRVPSSHAQDRDNSMNGTSLPRVGIDVSKSQLDVFVDDPPQAFCATYKEAGLLELERRLPAPGNCLVVLESSGGYERRVVAHLVGLGHAVAMVNPGDVRHFAKAQRQRAKTDRIDARLLAAFGRSIETRLVQPAPQKQGELAQFVARRRQLLDFRTAERNRLETLVSSGVRQSVQYLIDTLSKEITRIEKEILTLVQSDDEWRQRSELLQSVPGIGPTVANTLIAEMPELGRINRAQISALAGLAPYNHDSGKHQGKRAIAGGRTAVRNALYMAALAAQRCNDVIRAFAQRLKQAGKPFKVINTACMRKLLVILNTLVKTNSHWNPSLIHSFT